MKLCFSLALFYPFLVSAQVYNCNGVFKNIPCDVTQNKPAPLKEKVSTSDKEALKKKTLLHDVTMKSINYKKKHGIQQDISEGEKTCTNVESSLDECRIAVENLDAILEEKKIRALEVLAKEKELEASKTPALSQDAQQKTVVIINQPQIRTVPLINRRFNGIEVFRRPEPPMEKPPIQAPVPTAVVTFDPNRGASFGSRQ